MRARHKLATGIAAAIIAFPSPSYATTANADIGDIPEGTSQRKVMLIDIDGVRWDRLRQADTPNIDALAATGQLGPSYIHGTDVARTDSGPGHSNILTGTWPDKHKVRDNSFAGNDLGSHADVLSRLESVNPRLSTFSILDWQPINEHIIDAPDVKLRQSTDGGTAASDERTTATVERAVSERDPDVGYVYFHEPDEMGHEHGAGSQQYRTSIERVDDRVGRIVDAVRSRDSFAEEDWLFLLTTDHGFSYDHHGTDGHRTREVWTLASGGDIPATGTATRQWRQVDIPPTVFAHLGLEPKPAWDWDGIPIGTASRDPFDALAGSLDPADDEPAKPDDLLGFTKNLPSGWSVDEKTAAVGTAEYRGWSLMTGQFWATSQSGQGRESFFRGRDVIAVADADEWNDTGDPVGDGERLDSTLLSPWLNVDPGMSVRVDYLSHYRQVDRDADPQKAQLVLRYDDGTQSVLWSRDSSRGDAFDISKAESFTATAPAGVERVRVGWRLYDAANNFYWAFDDPRITVG